MLTILLSWPTFSKVNIWLVPTHALLCYEEKIFIARNFLRKPPFAFLESISKLSNIKGCSKLPPGHLDHTLKWNYDKTILATLEEMFGIMPVLGFTA